MLYEVITNGERTIFALCQAVTGIALKVGMHAPGTGKHHQGQHAAAHKNQQVFTQFSNVIHVGLPVPELNLPYHPNGMSYNFV